MDSKERSRTNGINTSTIRSKGKLPGSFINDVTQIWDFPGVLDQHFCIDQRLGIRQKNALLSHFLHFCIKILQKRGKNMEKFGRAFVMQSTPKADQNILMPFKDL